MKNEITIVTAFFNINRDKWNSSRINSDEYLFHFSSWARIKNRLIVYTDSFTAEKVKEIRSRYGLLEKTIVVIIDDFLSLDPELFLSIQRAMKAPHAREFHLKPNHPESWNDMYNYVMLLKWWCVSDAIKKHYTSGYTAWVDFGFNKSGIYYTKPEEFDFEWAPILDDKIYLFGINKIDDIPIYEIIQRMDTYLQGCSIVGQDEKWIDFSSLMRESMIELNNCGLCDDDQVIMLMCYRKNPSMFKIIDCPWFGMFKYLGCDNLTIRQNDAQKKTIVRIKNFYNKKKKKNSYRKMINKYFREQKRLLMKRNTIFD